jgi:hypothetical protein
MMANAFRIAVTFAVVATLLRAQVSVAVTPLPRDLEIELALSALPPHLRAGATVYGLNLETGFEVARPGSNGFHAFVARQDDTLYRGAWPLTHYTDDILIPIAFDAAGADTIMKVHFDIARLQAVGTPPDQLKQMVKERYEGGVYKAPARAGVSYMLAPVMRAYENSDQGDSLITRSNPHYMFYAPRVADEHIGGLPTSDGPFVINTGPHGYIIMLLGKAEKDAIVREYSSLLDRLCRFNLSFCLSR